MRRLLIGGVLIIILASMFQLSRLSESWHYVVPVEADEIIYATTFGDPAINWEQDQGQLSSEIVDGVMRLQVDLQNDGLYSAVDHYFTDFDVSVDTRAVGGVENNGYGLVFRQQDRQNYFMFLISSDGYYRVMRIVDNQSRVLSDWHNGFDEPVLETGLNITHRIRVVGVDDQFRFYINDELVPVCLPDDPDALSTIDPRNGNCLEGQWQETLVDDSISYGRLGVTVITDGIPAGPVVEFDNVLVFGVDTLPQD